MYKFKPKLNDLQILQELKNSCYANNDVRASWIAEYSMDTDVDEFKNYAKWSQLLWNMYKGFVNNITPFYISNADFIYFSKNI